MADAGVEGSAGKTVLSVAGLRKTYPLGRRRAPRVALDGVDFRVEAGEWVALLGPNGSGKSTLVRIISGADAPDDGRVVIFGHSMETGSPAARARMSIVFQKPGLDPLLTVRENLLSAAALFGMTGPSRAEHIKELARKLGLLERLEDRVLTLSGGLARRVDLARALLHEPELLILDEATAGLDHQSRTAFMDSIAELRARYGSRLTILMTTHLMDEAERAGRVVMMALGRVVADGAPAELRAAGGERIVRAGPLPDGQAEAVEQMLRETGLAVNRPDEWTVLARAGEGLAGLERAVLELTRRGVAFEVAPPNLGDAYLSITGTGLVAPEGGEEPPARRGRRR